MKSVERKITKLSIVKDGTNIEYEDTFTEEGEKVFRNATKDLVKWPRHPDLSDAVAELVPHFARLLEQDPEGEYEVRTVIYKEGKEWSGVMLGGFKRLSTGHVANMLTRLVKFNEPSEGYEDADALSELAETIASETRSLLDGKRAKDAQTSILDDDQQDGE